MEDPKIRFPALAAGQIDVAVTTVDTVLNYLSEQQGYRYLFAIDDSKGGDGIVADKDIESVADLKGKSRGLRRGLGLAVLSRRPAQGGRAVDQGRRDHEHDRGRCRRRVRRRAGRRRGHLGALADPRPAGAARPSAGGFLDQPRADHRHRDHHAREARGARRRPEGAVSRLGQGGRVPEGEREGGRRDHGARRRRLARGPGGVRRDPRRHRLLRRRHEPGLHRHPRGAGRHRRRRSSMPRSSAARSASSSTTSRPRT